MFFRDPMLAHAAKQPDADDEPWLDELEKGAASAPRPVRVAELLRDVQACATPERNITIVLELDESLHVAADERVLCLVVDKLLQNAIDVSPEGSRIVMRCRGEDLGVVIEVEDEAGGLPETAGAQLFRPFVEAGETTCDRVLALAVAQLAVHAMGGETYVENQPRRGCVFGVLLPPSGPARASTVPPASQTRSGAR